MSWSPQPGPQADAIAADWCPEVFYGGAAGGGKSDFLLGDFLQDVPTYASAWRGIIFRRTNNELEELLARSHELYPVTGATWREQKRMWTWTNGATLKFRYLEADRDATRYQGHQYCWIGFDELTQWSSLFPYRYLRGRLRSAQPVPTKRIRSAANPGGAGHTDVKGYFIDPAPGGHVPVLDDVTGMERMFIPSKLRDNAILVASDPGYAGRLSGLGSTELVRAMLEGDWTIVVGAFFCEFTTDRHVCRPFPIPETWTRFRCADWGSAAPFACIWLAVVQDTFKTPCGKTLPRGCVVAYREWYGCEASDFRKGLKLTSESFGAGVKKRDAGESIAYGVLDPSAFKEDGGPSISSGISKAGVHFRAADNTRLAGWNQVRSRLQGDADGRAMLVVFDTCTHLIRTLPALPHDPIRAEDVDTDAEDHAADALRYGLMSRPYTRPIEKHRSPDESYRRSTRTAGASSWRI